MKTYERTGIVLALCGIYGAVTDALSLLPKGLDTFVYACLFWGGIFVLLYWRKDE